MSFILYDLLSVHLVLAALLHGAVRPTVQADSKVTEQTSLLCCRHIGDGRGYVQVLTRHEICALFYNKDALCEMVTRQVLIITGVT
jgi:hypothetical protein